MGEHAWLTGITSDSGYVAACSCGWRGQAWSRPMEAQSEYLSHVGVDDPTLDPTRYVCDLCWDEFATIEALQGHIESETRALSPVVGDSE